MKNVKSVFSTLVVLCAAQAVWGAVNFPCGTYVIAGSVRKSNNAVFEADDNVVVQAVSTNGTVLAESQLTDPYAVGANGINCFLRIPLSSAASDRTAAVGDRVNILMKQNDNVSLASAPVTVFAANEITNLVVKVVDTYTYTNALDQTQVAVVSKDYVDTLALEGWLDDYGKTYDPFADYDADGSNNYGEYLNGTNPFDPSDRLKIRAAQMTAGGHFLVSFEYAGGHVYGVDVTTTLDSPAWTPKKLKTNEAGVEQTTVAYPGTGEDGDIATIYLVPAANAEFFRVGGK